MTTAGSRPAMFLLLQQQLSANFRNSQPGNESVIGNLQNGAWEGFGLVTFILLFMNLSGRNRKKENTKSKFKVAYYMYST